VSSLDGLVTTANDGRIALVNETGALTATRNLSANGAGSIDLRTHGVGQAITLDGATLSSTSGQVQLIAGGNIATTTATAAPPRSPPRATPCWWPAAA
jgi:hypothetical protein